MSLALVTWLRYRNQCVSRDPFNLPHVGFQCYHPVPALVPVPVLPALYQHWYRVSVLPAQAPGDCGFSAFNFANLVLLHAVHGESLVRTSAGVALMRFTLP